MAVLKAHVSIRKATLEAIVTVQKKNHRARVYVYRMLKKLGVSMGMFIDFISKLCCLVLFSTVSMPMPAYT